MDMALPLAEYVQHADVLVFALCGDATCDHCTGTVDVDLTAAR